jgi:hypothetical protein
VQEEYLEECMIEVLAEAKDAAPVGLAPKP